MKRVMLMLMAVVVCSLNVWCSNPSPKLKEERKSTIVAKSLVTKSMSDKIAKECLNRGGYCLNVFYTSNKDIISGSDIVKGKGREILNNLHKYPKCSENFIRDVYKIWGYKGLKTIGFNDNEIVISKRIIANTK